MTRNNERPAGGAAAETRGSGPNLADSPPRSPMLTSLARYLPRAAATATEMECLRRRAWRQDGVLSLRDGDDRLTWPERELVRQIGARLYGERRDATAATGE